MAEQALDGEQVAAGLQQVRGVGVPQGVRRHRLAQPGPPRRPLHDALHPGGCQGPAPAAAGGVPPGVRRPPSDEPRMARSEANNMTLWQGRFGESPADELMAYTASLPFDRLLSSGSKAKA